MALLSAVLVCQIWFATAADLTGAKTFALSGATPTPGVSKTATVSFTTAGEVPAEGKVLIVMPDLSSATQSGWSFETPAATCSGGITIASTSWAAGSRKLTITLGVGSSVMAAGTAYALAITNVRTPSSVVAAGTVDRKSVV